MVSTGTVCAFLIMVILYVTIVTAVMSFDDVTPSFVLIVMSPLIAFALFVAAHLLFQAATILTITADEIQLSRFGFLVTVCRRDAVTSAGFFTKYNNRGQYLYITADPKAMHEEVPPTRERQNTIYYILRKNANKKNAYHICVERTQKRTDVIKKLVPQFSESNDIRFPNRCN